MKAAIIEKWIQICVMASYNCIKWDKKTQEAIA